MIRIFLPDDFAKNPSITKVYNALISKILDQWEALPPENTIRTDPARPLDTRTQREAFLWAFLTAKEFYRYQIRRTCPFWSALDALADDTALRSILEDPASENAVQQFQKNYPFKEWDACYDILKTFQSEQKSATLSGFKKGFILDPLKEVFPYTHLTDEQRHTILTAMDVPVCPYCNMNYILSYDRDRKLCTTADLDHFYVKSKHPEYALCLYNMVPSCQVCNSRLKHTKDMTVDQHIYPHKNSFAGKAEFHVKNSVGTNCRNERM